MTVTTVVNRKGEVKKLEEPDGRRKIPVRPVCPLHGCIRIK